MSAGRFFIAAVLACLSLLPVTPGLVLDGWALARATAYGLLVALVFAASNLRRSRLDAVDRHPRESKPVCRSHVRRFHVMRKHKTHTKQA